MAAEPLFVGGTGTTSSASWQACTSKNRSKSQAQLLCFTIRASHSTDKKNKVYKQLGSSLFAETALMSLSCVCVCVHIYILFSSFKWLPPG